MNALTPTRRASGMALSKAFQAFAAVVNGLNQMECFDSGHIHNSEPLIDLGLLRPPYQFSLILDVLGGIPTTTKNLVHQVDMLPPESFWQVMALG
jgi:uncharacterized protein (DUF849 family)